MLGTKKISCIIILLLAMLGTHAQKIHIKGKVTDTKGEPLPFVTIKIKDTHTGTQSDVDGKFSLQYEKKTLTLIFSAVGYINTEKKLKEKDFKDSVANIIVKMEEHTSALTEVVVVGYGSERMAEEYSYSAPASASLAGEVKGDKTEPGTAKKIKLKSSPYVPKDEAVYEVETKTFASESTSLPVKEKQSSLLTAGEVNDFKKWKMWEDYNETDFKTHSNKWKLYATQRYSVQLQNNERKAVIGETVYLVNKDTKEIIWAAVSDNTGKAELWNGFSDNSKEKNLAIEVKGEIRQFIAVPFSQGINHIQLNRTCTSSKKVEISFVVDATGSMGDEIEYLKEELGDILTKFSLKQSSFELFTSAVFYKDKGDDYVTNIQPFTNNISSTAEFIKKQFAGGGGDYPEAVKEALDDALGKLKWSSTAETKIIFFLMDAPPHDETNKEMATLIAKAAAMGIRIVPVACSGTDKATEFIMRSMALATNGTYLFLTDDSGIGNPHIKPTTDEFKVELLNDLLLRTMEQMCYINTCDEKIKTIEPFSTYSNNEKVKIFPNPTQGPVTLETDEELLEIFVCDFTGKIVMRSQVKDIKKRYKIDLSGFPSATYFVKYVTKDNKTGAEKIVLLH